MGINDIMKLVRIKLSLAVAFSASAGCIFFSHTIRVESLYVFIGVCFLSCAASALNQFQERDLDLLMERTVRRPLPSGRMSPSAALVLSLILGSAGFFLLLSETTLQAALLGAFNLFWYNGIYTPLKRKTSFSLLVGAVTGAVPPVIGWTAAGGRIFDTGILFLACFMFMWQVPHFLLLTLKYGREYESAGIPSLQGSLSNVHIKRIIYIWMLGTSAGTLLFPVFRIIPGMIPALLLLALNCFFIIHFYRILFSGKSVRLHSAFRSVHLYCACVLLIVIAGVFEFSRFQF